MSKGSEITRRGRGFEHDDRRPGGQDPENENFRKIFVGGLNPETTKESLKQFYEQFGKTADVIVMRDPETRRGRGFGFVTWETRAMVDVAMAARPHIVDGKQVDPKRAVPKEARGEPNISTRRVFVAGLKEGIDEETLQQHFGKFGNVVKVDLPFDKTTAKVRGFAFVTFDDYDPVDKCVLEKYHTINGIRCESKKAHSKEELARQSYISDHVRSMQLARDYTYRSGRTRSTPTNRTAAINRQSNGNDGQWAAGGNGWNPTYDYAQQLSPVGLGYAEYSQQWDDAAANAQYTVSGDWDAGAFAQYVPTPSSQNNNGYTANSVQQWGQGKKY